MSPLIVNKKSDQRQEQFVHFTTHQQHPSPRTPCLLACLSPPAHTCQSVPLPARLHLSGATIINHVSPDLQLSQRSSVTHPTCRTPLPFLPLQDTSNLAFPTSNLTSLFLFLFSLRPPLSQLTSCLASPPFLSLLHSYILLPSPILPFLLSHLRFSRPSHLTPSTWILPVNLPHLDSPASSYLYLPQLGLTWIALHNIPYLSLPSRHYTYALPLDTHLSAKFTLKLLAPTYLYLSHLVLPVPKDNIAYLSPTTDHYTYVCSSI